MHELTIIGNNIIKLDAVDSTNTYAATLLKNQKVTEGLIIQAIHQTAGRGQVGTNWHSLPGDSMTFSVILTPSFLSAQMQFYLNIAISLGVYEYMLSKNTKELLIKWPNDILVNRKKIAGILIENTLKEIQIQYSIIGIGLNVNTVIDNLLLTATSIFVETKRISRISDELKQLAQCLDKYYMLLRLQKFANLKENYLQHLLGFRTMQTIKLNGLEYNIRVIDVEHSGKIVLEKENGQQMTASFKEFQWVL